MIDLGKRILKKLISNYIFLFCFFPSLSCSLMYKEVFFFQKHSLRGRRRRSAVGMGVL